MMNIALIVGNIIALIAAVIMMYTGYVKNKKKIIFLQTVQIGMSVISNLVLGGISGAVVNAVSCVRNIVCYKNKLDMKAKMIFVVVTTILTIAFNNLLFIGLLPLAASLTYIVFMTERNVIKFKIMTIATLIMWGIYDLYIQSYTAACFDFLTVATNIIAIVQIKKGMYKGVDRNGYPIKKQK
jgi:hypothetical protein